MHMPYRATAVTNLDPRRGARSPGKRAICNAAGSRPPTRSSHAPHCASPPMCWWIAGTVRRCREEQRALTETLACYNSGRFERPEYVRAVRASAEQIVPAIRLAGPAAPPAPRPQAVAEPPKEPAPPDPCAAVPAFDSWAKARCRERQRSSASNSQRRENLHPQPQAPEPKAEE